MRHGAHGRRRRTPRARATLLAALALLAAAAAPARAATTQELILEDEHRLLEFGIPEQQRTLDEMQALGVDRIRAVVWWRAVLRRGAARRRPAGNPANPRDRGFYSEARWRILDSLVRSAHERDIDLMLNPAASHGFAGSRLQLPGWARRHSGAPDAAEFAAFVRALGRRYSGRFVPPGARHPLPAVRQWSIWNEPNSRAFLHPQWRRVGGGVIPYAPLTYRRLYTAAARALRASGRNRRIYFGETTSTGAVERGPFASMAPGIFVRELACTGPGMRPYRGRAARLRGCRGYRPLDTDGLNTHLYTADRGQAPATQVDPAEAVWTPGAVWRPAKLLDALAARRRLPPGLPVYNTEAGFQAHPVSAQRVGLDEQAYNLNVSEYLQWREPRLRSFAQYLLYDDLFWFSGLRFVDGTPKPAYHAFRMPIVVRPAGERQVRVWGAAYGRRGDRLVEILINGFLHRYVHVSNPRGYFEVDVPAAPEGAVYELRDPVTGARSRWARVSRELP